VLSAVTVCFAGYSRYFDEKSPRQFVPGPFCFYTYEDLVQTVRLMQYSLQLTPVSYMSHILSMFALIFFSSAD